MLLAVIVEDDDKAAAELEGYIDRYAASCGEKIRTVRYGDAESFLVGYKTGVDIVFMDIELPDMDGMAAAAKLRERDSLVTIVFVTNMAQFAVKGYSVGAFDFLVKPVTYYGFATMMNRAAAVIHSNKVPEMTVRSSDGLRRVELANVQYIEVLGHKLIYHTDGDGDFGDTYNSSSFFQLGAEGAMLHVGLYVNDPQITAIFGTGATETNYGQYKLHQTMKHALYQYAHSGQIEGVLAWWWVWIWVVQNVVFLGIIALIIIFKVVPALKGKTKEQ